MPTSLLVFGALGLGAGTGLVILLTSLRRDEPGIPGVPWWQRWRARFREQRSLRWVIAAIAVAILVVALTGWVVGALIAAAAIWYLPRLLVSGREAEQRIEMIEAVAGWTEMLRDTLAAAAGLEQTITATAPISPAAIRPQVMEVAARLDRGDRLVSCLQGLASDLADPTADLVIAALMLSSEHQARQLAGLLSQLAATAREQVEMRQRVEVSRARARTTVRAVVIITFVFAGGLILLNPGFLAPYHSPGGQLVLAGIAGIFAVAIGWLQRLARVEEPERFFDLDTLAEPRAEQEAQP
jgi:tight adherence protein B